MINKARKGLTAVKTMAATQMPQHTLLILYKALVLSVIDYARLWPSNPPCNAIRKTRVVIHNGTQDTSAEAMRYLLDLPPMPDRHKLARFLVSADPGNQLYTRIVKQQNVV